MTPDEQTISEILSLDGGERFKVVNVLIKNRAVTFAEWLKISAWSHSPYMIEEPVWKLTGNFLLLNPTAENKNYSSEELYTLFLNHQ